MKAKSINGKSTLEVQSALQHSLSDGFKPTLAFVFLSTEQDWKTICNMLDKEGITIFGATTAGEFTDSGVDDGSSAILLLDLNPAYFTVAFEDIGTRSVSDTAKSIGKEGIQAFANPAFIVSGSHLETPGEAIIDGLVEVVGKNTMIAGGMAADAWPNQEQFVFSNNDCTHKGIITLILDQDKIRVFGKAISGWKPIGTPKMVTESEGNWIHSIDDKPALDVLLKFTGAKVDLDDGNTLFKNLGDSFPFQVQQATGDPVMKPPLLFDPKTKAIMCGGQVPQGSSIRFSQPPDFDVVQTVIQSAEKMKSDGSDEAEAMIIFSCIGRLTALGPLIGEEINGLKDVWDVPLAGLFCFGEFGRPEGGSPNFHGTTCSWVAMKEK